MKRTSQHYDGALGAHAGAGANANAFAERWIGTVRAEGLDWLLMAPEGTWSRS